MGSIFVSLGLVWDVVEGEEGTRGIVGYGLCMCCERGAMLVPDEPD